MQAFLSQMTSENSLTWNSERNPLSKPTNVYILFSAYMWNLAHPGFSVNFGTHYNNFPSAYDGNKCFVRYYWRTFLAGSSEIH